MKSFHIFTLLAAGLFLAAAIATYQPASHTSGGSYSFTNSYSVAPVNGNLYPDISQPTTKAVGDTSLPVSLTPAFSYAIGKVRLMGAEVSVDGVSAADASAVRTILASAV